MEVSKTLTLYFGVITGMIAFVIIAVGSIIIAVRYQKKLLKQQAILLNKDLQHKEELLISNIQSVEEERRRIAKDIHDELGAIFSTLFITVNQLTNSDTHNLQVIHTGKELINTGIKSVRRIAHSIIPDELELFGLNIALENYLTPLKTSIEINYTNTLAEGLLNPNEEIALYRIVQELVSNTLKHAAASGITLCCEANDRSIIIKYQDNGKGYDQNNELKKGGLGAKNIESRIIVMNAHMETVSTPGNGYSCTIGIPLPQNKLS